MKGFGRIKCVFLRVEAVLCELFGIFFVCLCARVCRGGLVGCEGGWMCQWVGKWVSVHACFMHIRKHAINTAILLFLGGFQFIKTNEVKNNTVKNV